VKLVKQQINGAERLVLKENATPEDVKLEAARMRKELGYDVQPEGRTGRYLATHKFYRGRYRLALEAD
jgi:hypothetical protein